MDAWPKIYASTETQLNEVLQITERFSNDIKMNLGLNKCRTCAKVKGKVYFFREYQYETNTIENLQLNKTYPYLELKQKPLIDHTTIKRIHLAL